MSLTYIIAPEVLEPYLGPSVVAHNLLKGFVRIETLIKKYGMEIVFVSLSSKGSRKVTEVSEMIKIINTRRFSPITFTGEVQAWWNSGKLENPDIVHSHDLYEVYPWINQNIPTIYTLHGIFWREKMFSRGMYMRTYYELAEKRLKWYYKKLAKLVAISPYVVRELLAKGFDITKVEVIENPVSDEFFNVKKREENLILYPATITPRKNQLTFLKAINLIKEELQDFRIVFTGSGNLKYYKFLKDFVQKSGIKNVKFLGKVPYDKILELYSKASVVVLVSYQETQPMVVLEAMATGTPVLASDIIQNRYMVTPGVNGMLAHPDNPIDIAEKLRKLIEDNKLRKKLGRNAKGEAERRWKSEVVARNTLKVYISIINKF